MADQENNTAQAIFSDLLSAGKEVMKARYQAKAAAPIYAEVAPTAQNLVNAAPAASSSESAPGMMDKLKAGDLTAWAIALGALGAVGFVAFKLVR